jgi:hypothetical protein
MTSERTLFDSEGRREYLCKAELERFLPAAAEHLSYECLTCEVLGENFFGKFFSRFCEGRSRRYGTHPDPSFPLNYPPSRLWGSRPGLGAR